MRSRGGRPIGRGSRTRPAGSRFRTATRRGDRSRRGPPGGPGGGQVGRGPPSPSRCCQTHPPNPPSHDRPHPPLRCLFLRSPPIIMPMMIMSHDDVPPAGSASGESVRGQSSSLRQVFGSKKPPKYALFACRSAGPSMMCFILFRGFQLFFGDRTPPPLPADDSVEACFQERPSPPLPPFQRTVAHTTPRPLGDVQGSGIGTTGDSRASPTPTPCHGCKSTGGLRGKAVPLRIRRMHSIICDENPGGWNPANLSYLFCFENVQPISQGGSFRLASGTMVSCQSCVHSSFSRSFSQIKISLDFSGIMHSPLPFTYEGGLIMHPQ